MKQKQRKKSWAKTKKIFSFFHRITGPGIVGFSGTVNKATKTEIPFIEADSKTSGQTG